MATTDSSGEAHATFSSGTTASSAGGLRIQASVLDLAANAPADAKPKTINIIISDSAGSVIISRGTTVVASEDNTAYLLPMSILVADVAGNPVVGATVTLSNWATYYSTGVRDTITAEYPVIENGSAVLTDTFANEDINGNTSLDAGEDSNGDGHLTPPNSAAGTVPRTVTTGEDGLASFNLRYLKEDADWVVDRITASTSVQGSEVTANYNIRLPTSKSDISAETLPDSPFNAGCPYSAVVNSASTLSIPPGGSSVVTVQLSPLPFCSELSPQSNSPCLADGISPPSLNSRPVTALVDNTQAVGDLNATATSGTTGVIGGVDGRFESTIAVSTLDAQAGDAATVHFYASCAKVSVRVVVGNATPAHITMSAFPSQVLPGGSVRVTAVVTDVDDTPVADWPVTFGATGDSGGFFGVAALTTDSHGQVSTTYTAGQQPGTDHLTVQASATLNATQDVRVNPSSPLVAAIELQAGAANIPVGGSGVNLRATVTNSFGQPLEGITVTFVTNAGTFQGLASVDKTTNTQGIADITLSSGDVVSTATVTANANGFLASTRVTFDPGSPKFVELSTAPGIVQPLGTAVVQAAVWDAEGNPVPGQQVAFSFVTNRSNGSVNPSVATTGLDGRATTTYTAGSTTGIDRLRAQAANGANIPQQGNQNPVDITVSAGGVVIGSVALQFGSATLVADGTSRVSLRAHVSDSGGQSVAGTTVQFSSDGGTLWDAFTGGNSVGSAVTDATGNAQLFLQSSTRIGVATVRVNATGFTDSGTVTFVAGDPATITLGAAPTTVNPGGIATLRATVVDVNGNAVSQQTVTFGFSANGNGITNASGALLSATTATTDTNGVATVVYTAGTRNGTTVAHDFLVAQTTNGRSSSPMDMTVDPSAAVVAGVVLTTGSASLPADGVSRTLLRATVTSTQGQPIVGLAVQFSNTVGVLEASDGTVANSASTNASGIAELYLKSPRIIGISTITATAGGFSDAATVSFTAGAPTQITLNAAPATVNLNGSSTIQATVLDALDNPVLGQTVSFDITSNRSGGSLGSTSAVTDGNGRATVIYVVGATGGTDIVRARLASGVQATATVVADAAATVVGSVAVSTGAASVMADGASRVSVRATVQDTAGHVAVGVTVDFTTTAGTLSQATAQTNSSGVAEVSLIAPTQVGSSTVTASVSGFSNSAVVSFTAGAPAQIALSAAPATVNPNGTSAIQVTVLDTFDNPVIGQAVSFSATVNQSGGSLGAVSAITDATGRATVVYTVGATGGTDTIRARLANGVQGTVDVVVDTSAVVVGSVALVTGAASVVADGTSTVSIRATVRDTSGLAAVGVTVDFATTAGTLSAAAAVTDSTGLAEVSLTAPTLVGSTTVTASASGFSSSAVVTLVAGGPALITLTAAPETINPHGASTILAAIVDTFGNPVVGQLVNFDLVTNGSGGSLGVASAVTDNSGRATAIYTAGVSNGTDVVRARLANGIVATTNIVVNTSATVVGSLVVVAGAVSVVADGASTVSIRATVRDTSGLPAVGMVVNFSTTAGILSAATAVTDATGGAEISLTAPNQVGNATVTGSLNGFVASTVVTFLAGAPAQVTLTAVPTVLNPGGTSTIQATVQDANGNAVTAHTVAFGITTNNSGAALSASAIVTDASGHALVTYTAGITGGVSDVVTATTTNGRSGQVTLNVNSVSVGAILVLSAANLVADGTQTTTVRAIVRDLNGNLAQGVTVAFSVSNGSVTVTAPVTGADGTASASLQAPTRTGSANIIASAGGISGNTSIQFIAGPAANVVLSAAPSTVAPTASTTLTVTVTDTQGNPVGNDSVRFSTSNNDSEGSLASTTVTTNANGVATVVYTAGVAGGGSVVTDTLKAEDLTVDPAVVIPGTVNVTVDPATITLTSLSLAIVNGTLTLTADGTSTARLRATVQRRTIGGGSVPSVGTSVVFETTAGSLDAGTAVTDSNGLAEVVLTAPTRTATATLTARTGGLTATTTLAFVAGAPDAGNSSLTANPQTLAADGASTSTVTVILADVNGNLVADGTSVTLVTTAGTIAINPVSTLSGRASFTLSAPTVTGTASLSVAQLPSLTTDVTFGSTSTGDPASILLSAGTTQISVAGVGQVENTTISLQIKDDAGNPIDESSYGDDSLNNLRVRMVTQPHGGEYVSGVNAASQVCTTLFGSSVDQLSCPGVSAGPVYLRTTHGSLTLNLQAGTLPGVVEVEIAVLLKADGSALSSPLTASLSQVVIASGPPHTIALTSPITNAVTNVGAGLYRRVGSASVTDRYGNNVPNGTVINLGLVDSVLAQGSAGVITAGDATLTAGTSLLTVSCTDSTTCNALVADFLTQVERNNTLRGIQANDRVLIENAQAQDKGRFVASPLTVASTTLEVQSPYVGTMPSGSIPAPLYTVGASLLGAQIAGSDASGGNLTVGTATTQDGIINFRVTYPAHNNNAGTSRGTILVGCYGYQADGSYSTDDKRYDVPQSTQVYVIANASNDSATAVDKGQFCFTSISGWTLGPDTSLSSSSNVTLLLQDGGDTVPLPFVGVSCLAVVTARDVTSDFDLAAVVQNNAENAKAQTDINGNVVVAVTVSGTALVSGDAGTVTCTAGDATGTISVAIP
ncbi:adhesin/invasin [Gammaproteobacteria bacterium]